ncbi:MAG: hypothetical protein R2861_10135 [Desulfobacterales bacterium]
MIDFLAKGGVLGSAHSFVFRTGPGHFSGAPDPVFPDAEPGAGLAEKVVELICSGKEKRHMTRLSGAISMGRVLTQAIGVKDQDREIIETVLVNATDNEVRNLSAYTQPWPPSATSRRCWVFWEPSSA